jgi:alpha-tubulin suppressor-like RCC1 family protein
MSITLYNLNSTILSINSTISTLQNSIATTPTNSITTYVTGASVNSITVNPMVGAGKFHSVFCIPNGKVMTCGDNTKGQLGIGSYDVSKNIPVYVKINATTDLTNVKSVHAGGDHTLFLLNDGTVYVCGDNTYGQLGIGNNTNQTYAVQIPNLLTVKSISAGTYHTMFLLNDGSVKACGKNTNGQLGDGTTLDRNTLVNVLLSASVKKVSCSLFHTMFLLNDGTVMGCGNNNNGQIGDGTKVQRLNPVYVKDSSENNFTNVIDIASGTYHTIFLSNTGKAYGCGIYFIELIPNATTPVYFAQSVTSIYSGYFSIIYIVENTILYTNGLNMSGILGINLRLNTYIYAPRKIPLSNKTVLYISIGHQHSLIYNNDSTCISSGNNANGQLGIYTNSVFEVLKNVILPSVFTDMTYNSNIIKINKYPVYSWGENNVGQLGQNSTTQLLVPTLINYFYVNNIRIIKACGGETGGHTLFLDTTGKVYSSGSNSTGAPAQGSTAFSTNYLTPTLVQYFVTNNIIIKDIACGMRHSLFLDTTGKAYSCGNNDRYQLGIGSYTTTNIGPAKFCTPILIQELVTNNKIITSIACGGSHSIFLDSNCLVYTCGYNLNGLLGLGYSHGIVNVPTVVPFIVTNNIKITSIAGPGDMTLFVDSINNKFYMAGLGLINYAVITNEKQIVNIAKSSYGAYLTDSIGNIYNISILTNINGQNTNLWIPAISANVANIKMIDTNTGGGVFTIDFDGRLFSSGTNAKGQLGHGDILTYTNLTLVQSNLTNISVTNVFCGQLTSFCTSREYETNLDNILNNVIN